MGFTSLTDKQLAMVPKEQRIALGKSGVTYAEAQDKSSNVEESKLHATFISWLRLNDLFFIHSTWGKKSTIAPGTPDFTIINRDKVCFVEFKGPSGRLRDDQKTVISQLESNNTPVIVTTELTTAINFCKLKLGL